MPTSRFAVVTVLLLALCNVTTPTSDTDTDTTSDDDHDDLIDDAYLKTLRDHYAALSDRDASDNVASRGGTKIASYSGVARPLPQPLLSQLMATLWNEDANSFQHLQDFRLNTKAKPLQRGEVANANAGALFEAFDNRIIQSATYSALLPLLNNYTPWIGTREVVSQQKTAEISRFLDLVLNTNVMKTAWTFLSRYGLVPADRQAFKSYLYHIWFSLYSRANGVLDSSGFEHVFVGEVGKGEVIGLHNWVRLYHIQKLGKLDYRGYFFLKNPGLASIQFKWLNAAKNVGTFFLGTSPEFEIAMYTTCFLLRPNEKCEFSIDKKKVKVITYQLKQGNGQPRVGTAFPI